MPKIRGKFTPLFDELFNDERWLLHLNDQQKLLYILILASVYQNNNAAPIDARYYQVRYNIGARLYQVKSSIEAIRKHFPKLIDKQKKLSLLNFVGYKNKVTPVEGLEEEIEGEIEGEGEKCNPTPPANVTKSTKDKCLEILKCKIFKNVSESDRVKVFESYPIDFLHDRLKSYAFRPKQIAIRGETFLKWLAEDFAKFKKEQAKQKSAEEESRRSREALKKMQAEAAAEPPPEFYEMKKKLKGGRK